MTTRNERNQAQIRDEMTRMDSSSNWRGNADLQNFNDSIQGTYQTIEELKKMFDEVLDVLAVSGEFPETPAYFESVLERIETITKSMESLALRCVNAYDGKYQTASEKIYRGTRQLKKKYITLKKIVLVKYQNKMYLFPDLRESASSNYTMREGL